MKSFELNDFTKIGPFTFVLKLENWEYAFVESYLLTCTEFVRENPKIVLLIFCHHPHCFTLGKGLQKLANTSQHKLIDFDESQNLIYPLYRLKRGGGLTFHYPGQVVFYPIVNLTTQKLNVHDLMIEILQMTNVVLEKIFNLNNLSINKELLGLWNNSHQKLASIGLAITRFTTYHGMALNFFNDPSMFNALKNLNPCGLPGVVYTNIENQVGHKLDQLDYDQFIECFTESFLSYLNNHLITERQISSDSINCEISF